MSESSIIKIIQSVLSGIPTLISLIRSGRKPANIKLSEFISVDAIKVLEDAKEDAKDYIKNG